MKVGKYLHGIMRSPGEQIWFARLREGEQVFFDIRRYFKSKKTGLFVPSKKGIAIPMDFAWPFFCGAVTVLKDQRKRDAIDGETGGNLNDRIRWYLEIPDTAEEKTGQVDQ